MRLFAMHPLLERKFALFAIMTTPLCLKGDVIGKTRQFMISRFQATLCTDYEEVAMEKFYLNYFIATSAECHRWFRFITPQQKSEMLEWLVQSELAR